MDKKAKSFAVRLKEALDDLGIPERGRQMLLSREFKVSQPSAKRWLDGQNYPDTEKIIEIALWSKTSIDWLLTGRGEKHPQYLENQGELNSAIQALINLPAEKRAIALRLLQAL